MAHPVSHALALPRCQAISTRTFRPCCNGPAPGSRFCRVHPPERLARGALLTPGRRAPAKTGTYLRAFSATGRQVYEETLGDISPLAELAAARALLAEVLERRRETDELEQFLMSVPPGGGLGSLPDGSLAPVPSESDLAMQRIRKNRKQTADDMDVVAALDRVVKMASQAAEMLAGRRVMLTFEDRTAEEEVRRQIEAFVREFFVWIPPILCMPCRTRLSEELLNGRRTEIVSE